jgi:signal transduction histidine kinase
MTAGRDADRAHRPPAPTGSERDLDNADGVPWADAARGTRNVHGPPRHRIVSGSADGDARQPAATSRRPPAGRRIGGTSAADAALVLVAFLVTVVVAPEPDGDLALRGIGDVPAGELALTALACAVLYWRRSRPLAVLAVTLVAATVSFAADLSDLSGLAAFVALYSVGRYVDDDRWSVAGLACVLTMATVGTVTDPSSTPAEVGFGVTITALVWYAGRRMRARDEDAVRLRHEHAAGARRAIADERARIARELHDIVAHRVSLMTVQAGAARTVVADDPEAAARAMQAIEHAGRQALDELRHLFGVLRPDADGGALDPQPGLVDIEALIDRFRAAGLHVSLTISGAPVELPARVELSAYRVVQEALTNALKHAGPGARTEVRVDLADDAVDITVRDDGHGGRVLPGSGHGILGMRERALLLGGRLDAAPHPDGGFQVVAHLPGQQERA